MGQSVNTIQQKNLQDIESINSEKLFLKKIFNVLFQFSISNQDTINAFITKTIITKKVLDFPTAMLERKIEPTIGTNWKITKLSQMNVKQEALKLIPHVADSINEQPFFNNKVERIQVRNENNSWIVFRTEYEINSFFRKIDAHIHKKFDSFDSSFNNSIYLISAESYFREFFEIEFQDLRKIVSIRMQKKLGGNYGKTCFCKPKWLLWKNKKLILTEDGILVSDDSYHLQQNFPFTNLFKYDIAQSEEEYGIVIRSNYHKLEIRANDVRSYFLFIYFLNQIRRKQQEATPHYRFGSFAPIREDNHVQFIIDAEKYFLKVAEALRSANVEVFITGWWVSPQVCLVRNTKENYRKDRLDLIIKQIADRGVKVYILVYCQSSFLSNDSAYTVSVFSKMGPNVKILRHPDIVLPTFWTHHEKLIVIDQSYAFVGGIDLCYGRFDNPKHSIQDDSLIRYPGVQYNNARIKDFINLSQYTNDAIPRYLPRLPWHDIAVEVLGPCVKDISSHFLDYWNFVSFQSKQMKKIMLLSQSSKVISAESNTNGNKFMQRLNKNVKKITNIFYHKQGKQEQLSPNSRIQKLQTIHVDVLPSSSNSAFSLVKEVMVEQKVQQIKVIPNQIKIEEGQKYVKKQLISKKIEDNRNLDLLSKVQPDQEQPGSEDTLTYVSPTRKTLQKAKTFAIQKKMSLEATDFQQRFSGQILRSASKWSIGFRSSSPTENSILQAYIQLIKEAKRFIYIQNQFFISSVKEQDVVENLIAITISERIKQACEKNEQFYVLVVLPLIPAFPGEISDGEASIPRGIMHWQYRTISRHKSSLLTRIQEFTSNPQRYIRFYGLRVHGLIYDKPFTQILYVHSKMMIVDDKKVIIGSANINDRSMNGDRDSQVCILIQSNKQTTPNKISSFRKEIWKEHFDIPQDMMDPSNIEHMKNIESIAKKNTEIYRKVFGCYPDDNIVRMKDIQRLRQQANIELYYQQIENIKGHVVEFPLQFLSKQSLTNLTPDAISI